VSPLSNALQTGYREFSYFDREISLEFVIEEIKKIPADLQKTAYLVYDESTKWFDFETPVPIIMIISTTQLANTNNKQFTYF
jgi:tRNA dimethylallyltransferase